MEKLDLTVSQLEFALRAVYERTENPNKEFIDDYIMQVKHYFGIAE